MPAPFPPPRGVVGVRATFGDIRVEGEQVVAPKGWEASCVRRVLLPGREDKPLRAHRLVHPMLVELFARWLAAGFRPKTVGCFAPRAKRSNPESLSLHSWAIAIDVDADDNPARAIARGANVLGLPRKITDAQVAIAENIGWVWGGRFSTYYDPMHFQWAAGV